MAVITSNMPKIMNKLRKLKHNDLQNVMRGVSLILEASIKDEIGLQGLVKTGNYRSSVHSWAQGKKAFVRSGLGYSVVIEKGSKPHTIFPRHRKSLKFNVSGRTVFAKRVQHPGTVARHPFKKGGDKGIKDAGEFIIKRLWRGV